MTASRSAHVDTFTRDHLPPESELPTVVLDRPELHYPELLNCAEALLDRTVERFGSERLCLLSDDERWTYGDLLARSNQIAHVLVDQLGVVPGNLVEAVVAGQDEHRAGIAHRTADAGQEVGGAGARGRQAGAQAMRQPAGGISGARGRALVPGRGE